jgi:hypothetical protein
MGGYMRFIDMDYKPDNLDEVTLVLGLSLKELERMTAIGDSILLDINIAKEENENKYKERRYDYKQDEDGELHV